MKNFTLTIFCLLLASANTTAQVYPFITQTWAANQLGTAAGVDVVTDLAGYTYVVGNYDDEVCFDANLIGGNYGTMFVAKYDPQGVVKWVRAISGNSNNKMVAVDIDNAANLYVTGEYLQTNSNTILDFGTFTVTGNGSSSTFIAKIDSTGNWQWVNTMLSTGPSAINGKEVRPYDLTWTIQGPVIAGRIREQVTVDGNTYNDINDNTFFFAQFNTDGDLNWYKQGTGLVYDLRFQTGNDSKVYFVGNANGDPGYDGASLEDEGAGDVVFGAINLSGTLAWWNLAGHFSYNERSKDITLDQNNNMYLTFGNPFFVQINDTTVSTVGAANWYLYKFNNLGVFQWIAPLSSSMSGYTYNHLTTPQGITYVTGFVESPSFTQPVEFWGDNVGEFGAKEVFFAAYAADGSYLDVTGFEFEDSGNPTYMGEFLPGEMRFDHQGKIVITGSWNEQIIIGNDTLVNDAWPHQKQMFLLKADPNLLFDHSTSIVEGTTTNNLFSLYPNPAENTLTIQSADGNWPTTVAVYSTTGQLMIQRDIEGNKSTIDVSTLSPGIYYLSLSDGKQTVNKKFVKQ